MAAVAVRMQHPRLPTQHLARDTPTCRAQAFGGQPLIVGFGYQEAHFQPPQQKVYLPKAHRVVRAVARHQVLVELQQSSVGATAAHQESNLRQHLSSGEVAVLERLAQLV
jgi:hypothetical protein